MRQYNTKQRDSIMKFFKAHSDECFTAKHIIENNNFNIGEATVYRLLTKLSNEGSLKKYISDKGLGSVYQYNDKVRCGKHFHLKCITCGEAICMDCTFMDRVEQHIENEHDFSIDNTKTILYGVCKICSKI